ncbi:hypothetical protein GF339_12305 [candidate division KSB3 bacterium]|uniref:Uncharacterized protein n=1 Tax=candidate division KSB3 bacterium TaxID=2044937 RepID=A0A9D5Q6G2_9BACT|nr:hypothetical protein [candidate division KSB3 bacterium]MBD3325363.1 hypothetical protein [candidate division KSB3 bacterium]
MAAEQEGKTVDEVIDDMTKEIDDMIAREANAFTRDALEALKRFVRDPDEIRIVVDPDAPVPLGRLQGVDPLRLPEILNIQVKT